MQKQDEGFTLIELLIVIVILGILATVVVFAVGGITDRGQDSACDTDRATLEVAVEAYFAKAEYVPHYSGGNDSPGSYKFLRSESTTCTRSALVARSPASVSAPPDVSGFSKAPPPIGRRGLRLFKGGCMLKRVDIHTDITEVATIQRKSDAFRGRDGFTLIELLIVIVILGILATVVVFAVGGITDRGEVSVCASDERTLATAVEAYFGKHATLAIPSGGAGHDRLRIDA